MSKLYTQFVESANIVDSKTGATLRQTMTYRISPAFTHEWQG